MDSILVYVFLEIFELKTYRRGTTQSIDELLISGQSGETTTTHDKNKLGPYLDWNYLLQFEWYSLGNVWWNLPSFSIDTPSVMCFFSICFLILPSWVVEIIYPNNWEERPFWNHLSHEKKWFVGLEMNCYIWLQLSLVSSCQAWASHTSARAKNVDPRRKKLGFSRLEPPTWWIEKVPNFPSKRCPIKHHGKFCIPSHRIIKLWYKTKTTACWNRHPATEIVRKPCSLLNLFFNVDYIFDTIINRSGLHQAWRGWYRPGLPGCIKERSWLEPGS